MIRLGFEFGFFVFLIFILKNFIFVRDIKDYFIKVNIEE